jgi:hypothetical protein
VLNLFANYLDDCNPNGKMYTTGATVLIYFCGMDKEEPEFVRRILSLAKPTSSLLNARDLKGSLIFVTLHIKKIECIQASMHYRMRVLVTILKLLNYSLVLVLT